MTPRRAAVVAALMLERYGDFEALDLERAPTWHQQHRIAAVHPKPAPIDPMADTLPAIAQRRWQLLDATREYDERIA